MGAEEKKHDEKHESLCRRCGKCCRYRVRRAGGGFYYTPFHCPWLDREAKTCTIYENRRELRAQCCSIEKAARISVLPNDCPYVQGIKGYEGPEEFPDFWEQSDEVIQAIANSYDPPISAVEVEAVKRDWERGVWGTKKRKRRPKPKRR